MLLEGKQLGAGDLFNKEKEAMESSIVKQLVELAEANEN